MLKDYLTEKPMLETERLILRTLTPDDVDDLKEWLGLDAVYKYWGRKASGGECNPETLFVDPRPWVKRKPILDFKWGIELKETKKIIGDLSIFDIQNFRMGDVAYRINPLYWNKGITTEALLTVIDFIYNHTEIDRLNATADIRNIGSTRVLEKCGFVKEGLIRHGKMVSVYSDYYIYGLLVEDYRKK